MVRKRAKHSAAFKAKVALEAVREQAPMADIARKYKVHANIVYKWKRQLLDNLAVVFETNARDDSDASEREAELLRKIGELTWNSKVWPQSRERVSGHPSTRCTRTCLWRILTHAAAGSSTRPPQWSVHRKLVNSAASGLDLPATSTGVCPCGPA